MLQVSLTRQRGASDVDAAETRSEDASKPDAPETPGDRPWRRAVIAAAVVWFGSHLGYLAVNFMAWRVGRMQEPHLRYLLSAWYRWDTGHYVRIADHGYGVAELDRAFFPFYPILIKLATYVLPGSTHFAALVVANIACFGALMMVYRLTNLEFGHLRAERTVYFLIAFPTAFFLSAAYNTALFVLLTTSALYCMRKGSWWAAGLLGAFATATRSSGVLLILPFLYEYLRQRRFRVRDIRPGILAGGLIFGGIGAFSLYCWRAFGDPLAFAHIQSAWGRTFHWPWTSLIETVQAIARRPKLHEFALTNGLDLVAALVILTLVALAMVGPWKFRPDQAYLVIFAAAVALFPLFAGTDGDARPIVSTSRHVLEAVPAFMVLAAIGANRHVERIYVLSAVALQAILLAVFMHYDWVA